MRLSALFTVSRRSGVAFRLILQGTSSGQEAIERARNVNVALEIKLCNYYIVNSAGMWNFSKGKR